MLFSKIKKIALKYIIYIVFIVLVLIMAFISPVFLTTANIVNVLLQISVIGTVAIGMTYVIIGQNIDVSVGSIVAVSSICGVYAHCNFNVHPIIAILIIICVAVLFELINGLSVAYLNMPSFVVTLATMQIARGISYSISGGRSVYGMPNEIYYIGNSSVGRVPLPIIIFIVCAIIGYIILSHTVFGKKIYATGGNREAAKISGINVKKNIVSTFVLNGIFIGLASVVLTARMNSFYPSMGTGYEFDAIASVVIGGASLLGGIGLIQGTILGVFILGVINNSMNLLGVGSFLQLVFKGLIIFVAVMIDALRTRSKTF